MPALVRLLEVSVLAVEPTRWRWCVSQGDAEVADGYEGRVKTLRQRVILHCLVCSQNRGDNDKLNGR